MNSSAPNPFQPIIDAAVSGFSKVAAAIVLGALVYLVVVFAFRLAGRGGQFSNIVGRAAMGFSALFFLYVGFVVLGPAKTGVAQSAAAEDSSVVVAPASPKTGAATDQMGSMISGILGEIDDRWSEIFQTGGQSYSGPRIVLYRNIANGGRCGRVEWTMGPFYCAPDQRIFLATEVFHEIETRLNGCSGNACKFTAAHIIARQAGHHIQNLLGILPRATRLQEQAGSKAESQALQVKVELQADCLSGVWVNREEKKRPGFLEAGDIDAALTTASAIDDDAQVVPDSFTHGSTEQRKHWFMTGYQQGTLQACNTFAAGAL